jgi:hypothetical protein
MKRVEVGDHDNDEFEPIDPASHHHVKPGFDAGEEVGPAAEGEHQFPHRRREEELPKGSLADRLREHHRRGA